MKYFFKALSLVSLIAAEMPSILADGRVTVRELLDLSIKLADKLGYDVDHEGLSLKQ